jgi:hypothetical protein
MPSTRVEGRAKIAGMDDQIIDAAMARAACTRMPSGPILWPDGS